LIINGYCIIFATVLIDFTQVGDIKYPTLLTGFTQVPCVGFFN